MNCRSYVLFQIFIIRGILFVETKQKTMEESTFDDFLMPIWHHISEFIPEVKYPGLIEEAKNCDPPPESEKLHNVVKDISEVLPYSDKFISRNMTKPEYGFTYIGPENKNLSMSMKKIPACRLGYYLYHPNGTFPHENTVATKLCDKNEAPDPLIQSPHNCLHFKYVNVDFGAEYEEEQKEYSQEMIYEETLYKIAEENDEHTEREWSDYEEEFWEEEVHQESTREESRETTLSLEEIREENDYFVLDNYFYVSDDT